MLSAYDPDRLRRPCPASLNAHFHYHLIVLDGTFSGADDGSLPFPMRNHATLRIREHGGRETEASVDFLVVAG